MPLRNKKGKITLNDLRTVRQRWLTKQIPPPPADGHFKGGSLERKGQAQNVGPWPGAGDSTTPGTFFVLGSSNEK